MTKEHVRQVIDTYFRAWTTQDPDLILTIFTPTATYHERVLEAAWCNEAGIRDYWETRVVKEEANIEVELLSLYLDGDTAIAEWEAHFDDVVGGNRKHMLEVAILDFEDGKIAKLREYWAAETVGPATVAG
ncbi:nuclear transport factor 2 family protein [Mycobacterium sp. M1]|uniref:Nuclear transport factor 2 family protein n=1 Tax=Mycolicibacter acidiphilus TaxID=2835306 RepID=A0ABS5RMQ4_9MYCO|nr:nuclear transport factor 2 family protein [Mycolicibacter acidiphilus]